MLSALGCTHNPKNESHNDSILWRIKMPMSFVNSYHASVPKQRWIGGQVVYCLGCGFEGPGFNHRSRHILCETHFCVSHLHGVEKMCLLTSHAWKNIVTSSHWNVTRLVKLRAFTSRHHVPRRGIGEGRNQVRHVVTNQRRWMWVTTNMKKSLTSKTDQKYPEEEGGKKRRKRCAQTSTSTW